MQVGRASATTVEILAGLTAGDRVILSDTSMWDSKDQLKLE